MLSLTKMMNKKTKVMYKFTDHEDIFWTVEARMVSQGDENCQSKWKIVIIRSSKDRFPPRMDTTEYTVYFPKDEVPQKEDIVKEIIIRCEEWWKLFIKHAIEYEDTEDTDKYVL